MKLHICADFAETLVKERPMIEWVLFELSNKPLPIHKICFLLNSFMRGFLSMLFGRFRLTAEWSAKIAYMSFKGVNEDSLERMIYCRKDSGYIINLNPRFLIALSKVQDKYIGHSETIELSIHSQGTCSKAIEIFMKRNDVVDALSKAKVNFSYIVANQLEIIEGKFTGNLVGKIITKYNKPETIPDGSIFIGDNHDRKSVNKLKHKKFDFIRI